MMERKDCFDYISSRLTVIKMDLEHHQSINDYSLNIHGENFYRDVFNLIYDASFRNTNFNTKNAESIDLIDEITNFAYQITTTKSLDKIKKTLRYLRDENHKKYNIRIYYLLEKPNLTKKSKNSILSEYGIDIDKCIFDSSDLMIDINNLEDSKLRDLKIMFSKVGDLYTDEIVLDMAVTQLVKDFSLSAYNNEGDFSSPLGFEEKIKLNSLGDGNKYRLTDGINHQTLMYNLEDTVLVDLREYIINHLYFGIVKRHLRSKYKREQLCEMKIEECKDLLKNQDEAISELGNCISEKIKIRDFNNKNFTWIIIAHFFEICDIARKV